MNMSDSTLYNRLMDLTVAQFLCPDGGKRPEVECEHDSAVSEQAQLRSRLTQFIECEGKSCSFDPELITPEYVFRMWGGKVPFEQIEEAFRVHGSRVTGLMLVQGRIRLMVQC